VLYDEGSGEIRMSKVSSTPGEPSRAVFDSFAKAGGQKARSRWGENRAIV